MSTEYPPMKGGVGRYCRNLVDALRKNDLEVLVVCNEYGNGEFKGISPNNPNNSEVILRLVKDVSPDLVHVQYEQGLYGIHLDPLNPRRTTTNIESFYSKCRIPVVSTFHSAYTFKQWMNLTVPLVNKRFGKLGTYSGMIYDYWTHLINYKSFHLLSRRKVGPSRVGIVFSKYMADLIPGTHLIYHGSESHIWPPPDRNDARKIFSLPVESKIALASGFMTATKGWDVIRKMKVPEGWKVVVNSSRNHYNVERPASRIDNLGVIELEKGFLDDRQLSLLFYSSDALILPYKVSSGSGVMFDGLAHNLPFVASNIEFFKEFSEMGLGVLVNRSPAEFSRGLLTLEQKLEEYKRKVKEFSKNLTWKSIAEKHLTLYNFIISNPDMSVSKKNLFL
ncbi:MAG: glycosyltransferase [Candidatus Eiseniibacteriota bacterium]